MAKKLSKRGKAAGKATSKRGAKARGGRASGRKAGTRRVTSNVSLTRRMQEFIDGLVESGKYQSSSEVVREGVRRLMEEQRTREWVRREVALGVEAVERGDVVDGDSVFDEWERRDREAQAPQRRRSA